MAIRRALLTALLVLALAGWAGAASKRPAAGSCGGCHTAHRADQGSCAVCHRGDPLALRKEIAHQRLLSGRAADHARADAPAVAEGRRLVERLACRRCHVVGGSGNRLATELDRVAWERDQRELQRSIASPVENMPLFGLDGGQTDSVIALLLHGADPQHAEAAYRVRFADAGAKGDSTFGSRCGGCHRALTPSGPVGGASAGPNLSGLLSPFYPVPANDEWTEGKLGKWLENPRAARALAAMRPVRLEHGEVQRLAGELTVPPGRTARANPSLGRK